MTIDMPETNGNILLVQNLKIGPELLLFNIGFVHLNLI